VPKEDAGLRIDFRHVEEDLHPRRDKASASDLFRGATRPLELRAGRRSRASGRRVADRIWHPIEFAAFCTVALAWFGASEDGSA
jgi:hypothetical protein